MRILLNSIPLLEPDVSIDWQTGEFVICGIGTADDLHALLSGPDEAVVDGRACQVKILTLPEPTASRRAASRSRGGGKSGFVE